METAGKYSLLKPGFVYIDYGPITMTLEAQRRGAPFTEAAIAGAEKALEVFEDLTAHLAFLRTAVGASPNVPVRMPAAVSKMTRSVLTLEEADFTPLAAVAGTTADQVAGRMYEYGADYALANNGGDIAWRIGVQKESLNVGIISDVSQGATTHLLKIFAYEKIRGLATSGLGGRSLTRGIASSVTALASSSSLADAAATAIANAAVCEDPAIEQCPARELDPLTDIPDLFVTKAVGPVSRKNARIALAEGKRRAQELVSKGMIFGAVIFVMGEMALVEAPHENKMFEVRELIE